MNDLFHIRQIASELSENLDAATDLYSILKNNNIRYKEFDLGLDNRGKPILGACKSEGLKRLIVLSPSIAHLPRKRFTLAHEIGHIFLHHENKFCITTDFEFWRDKQSEEVEANSFAAELLIPYVKTREELRKGDLGFTMIDSLASRYEISTMATAIRLVKEDTGMSIVIYHDDRRIDWAIRSPSCREDIDLILVGRRAISIPSGQKVVTTKPSDVDPSFWFTKYEELDNWVCREETRYYPQINRYLTVLNIYEQ